jgi:membrane-associated protease RseP (regulator of RpoE activity)
MMRFTNSIGLGAWLLLAGLVAVAGPEALAQDDAARRGLRKGRPDTTLINDVDLTLVNDVDQEPAEHWIGVYCLPVGEALRMHLGLADDQGLLVAHVADESPAAEAGLKRHDILLKAADTPIHTTPELIKAVRKSKGEAITFEILRAGKKQTVTIEPDRRPEKRDQVEVDVFAPVPDGPEFKKWISEWVQNPGLNRIPARYRRIAEGWLADRPKNLPEGVTVTITKEGAKPAQITVREGAQTWQATDEELEKLPEKARPFVEGMLGRVTDFDVEVEVLGPAERKARDYIQRFEQWLPSSEGLERRVEQLEKRLEEVIDEFRAPRENRDQKEPEQDDKLKNDEK